MSQTTVRTLIKKKKIFITDDQKMFICNMIAQYKKPREVVELIKDEHDINIDSALVSRYKKDNQKLINKLRETFLSTVVEVPIAQKRVRLERTEELYDIAKSVPVKLKCLSSAREEVEGKGAGGVTFQQFNQYNQLTDEELQEKIKEIEFKVAKASAEEV